MRTGIPNRESDVSISNRVCFVCLKQSFSFKPKRETAFRREATRDRTNSCAEILLLGVSDDYDFVVFLTKQPEMKLRPDRSRDRSEPAKNHIVT